MKKIKLFLLIIVSVLFIIAIAGIIKFNILQDDIYVKKDDGTVVKYDVAKDD